MTQNPGSSRRYTDDEIQRLLKRAAELESEKPSLPAPVDGPTLEEIESIASEAGINPALVRQAALEMESPTSGVTVLAPQSSAFLGAPTVFELERVVRGEATQATLESLVPHLQRAADGMGHPSLMRNTLTWQSEDSSKMRALLVTVSAERGQTRLNIEERYGNLAGSLFGGIVGGGGTGLGFGVGFGVGLGALGSALFATVFPFVALGGTWALARGIYKHSVHNRMRRLTKLMNEMVAMVEYGVEEDEGGGALTSG
ncbi:MAG: hypothetical protein HKO65_02675 [Gemmatimonadetes bacterium]|nr:hypothetical protein [Gemmatimonadota bacterium]NNM03981.1 hypothetical protein [Gemmatimonadota bacterium]